MNQLNFKSALLPTGWAENVSIGVDAQGNIADVRVGSSNCGPVEKGLKFEPLCALPGIANLHSHAHQRAMAGLAERSGDRADSFWTWRSTMYEFLRAIGPQQLHAIASQLYVEMLKAGYTRVAEFQYLHHQPDGRHYDNIAEMSIQTVRAAQEVGLGITNLPVHYQFSGFGSQDAVPQQHRFTSTVDDFLKIVETLETNSADDANITTGFAGHSLRAVSKQSMSEVLAQRTEGPIHLHIAEQQKEVTDCLAWCGARPLEYLYEHFDVDQRWCLIHATHMTDAETRALAESEAVAGLCPTTEANLGDGFFNASPYLAGGGRMGIGSDSHISVSPTEELRWLEYGQRLRHLSRNQLSAGANMSTGRSLFDLAVAGGAQACAHDSGAIEVGKRADFVALDLKHSTLCERQGDELLDSWIFSGNSNPVRDVYVGGVQVIKDGQHAQQESIQQRYQQTMHQLRNQ